MPNYLFLNILLKSLPELKDIKFFYVVSQRKLRSSSMQKKNRLTKCGFCFLWQISRHIQYTVANCSSYVRFYPSNFYFLSYFTYNILCKSVNIDYSLFPFAYKEHFRWFTVHYLITYIHSFRINMYYFSY